MHEPGWPDRIDLKVETHRSFEKLKPGSKLSVSEIEKSRRVVESRLVCMVFKSGIKSRISRIIQEFMGLRSKRRNSPYIFQVVASPQTKAYIIVQVLVYKICAADLYGHLQWRAC